MKEFIPDSGHFNVHCVPTPLPTLEIWRSTQSVSTVSIIIRSKIEIKLLRFFFCIFFSDKHETKSMMRRDHQIKFVVYTRLEFGYFVHLWLFPVSITVCYFRI